MNEPAVPLKDSREILVIMPTWLGDCVMATPVLHALAQEGRKLWLAIPHQLSGLMNSPSAPWQAIHIDGKGMLGPWRAARQLRAGGVPTSAAVLILPNSLRSALLARVLGAPIRCGWATDLRAWLLSHALPRPAQSAPISAVDWYADLAQWATGLSISDRRLRLHLYDDTSLNPSLSSTLPKRFLILNPGGNNPAKRWPAQRFAALAQTLHRRGHGIVLSGSPAESSLLQQIEHLAGVPLLNLQQVGVDLKTLMSIVSRADLLVTNDTGTRHIAAALGTPTVCLFGPTDRRFTTLTGANEWHVVAQPFLPEALVADRVPQACSMDRICLGDVLHGCNQLLRSDCK